MKSAHLRRCLVLWLPNVQQKDWFYYTATANIRLACFPRVTSWSMAAGLYTSVATIMTLFPCNPKLVIIRIVTPVMCTLQANLRLQNKADSWIGAKFDKIYTTLITVTETSESKYSLLVQPPINQSNCTFFLQKRASFPHAVVFPTPCSPAIKMTVGPDLANSMPTISPPMRPTNSSFTTCSITTVSLLCTSLVQKIDMRSRGHGHSISA